MSVEIGIRIALELATQNGRVQDALADCMTNEEILAVKLAEETIVIRQLSGYLVHLASLISRSDYK